MIFSRNNEPVNGEIEVNEGKLTDGTVQIRGDSRIHSAKLTTFAFSKSFLGDNGKYIVTVGLILFAFSTVISWSYYGGRAITFLLGSRFVMPYRMIYILIFFIGSFTEVTLVWKIAEIAIVLMTLPNLIGILLLSRDMKTSVGEYWRYFREKYPKESKKIRIKELES
jgi:AGCS family alanine or glycine:cation symporter